MFNNICHGDTNDDAHVFTDGVTHSPIALAASYGNKHVKQPQKILSDNRNTCSPLEESLVACKVTILRLALVYYTVNVHPRNDVNFLIFDACFLPRGFLCTNTL